MKLETLKDCKDWFKQIPILRKYKNAKIRIYQAMGGDYQGILLTDGKLGFNDPYTERIRQRITTYRQKCIDAQEQYATILERADWLLKQMPPDEARVISLHFIEQRSWERVALDVCWSRRQCFRIADRGFAMILGQEVPEMRL